METWVIVIVIVAVGGLLYVAQHFGWIDLSDKSKSGSSGGGAMGIGDEIFNPSRYEAQVELDRQTILPAPAPLPGDDDKGLADRRIGEPGSDSRGIYDGQMKISLTDDDRSGQADPPSK